MHGYTDGIRFVSRTIIPSAQAHFGKAVATCGAHEAFSLPGSMVATEPVGANVTVTLVGVAARHHRAAFRTCVRRGPGALGVVHTFVRACVRVAAPAGLRECVRARCVLVCVCVCVCLRVSVCVCVCVSVCVGVSERVCKSE